MLKAILLAGAAASLPQRAFGQASDWAKGIPAYLEGLARPDGGYGWEGQERSHLTPTFYATGCYRLLKLKPPRPAALIDFVRTHHPGALKKLEQERRIFDWQQIQTLAWLGADLTEFKPKILQWTQPLAYLKQYERHGYPLFSSEMGVILSRVLLGIPAGDTPPAFVEYLQSRRRQNGSFNNTPASDGGDGHVMSTWWALQAFTALGRAPEEPARLVKWLRSCQRPSGGFTFAPDPEFGGIEDVAYTWTAVRSLNLLGSKAANQASAIQWVSSLANADGGFSDRPGWLSNPMATFYALDALDAMDALQAAFSVRPRIPTPRPRLPSNLRIFSVQLEAHGQGSPMEAVELARSLRIHLWGAKNAKPTWLARAQALADEQTVPVKFFVANEEYGTWVNIPGLGTYSHTSDIIAPADARIGSPMTGQRAVSWGEFREGRLAPLEKGQGRLIWQFGENEELVRMFLDDSVQRGGYAAISTYHFGNPDFTNSEPFLHRWRGQIPFVALQDAHGPEPWWFADMTTGFRTLFLAEEPSWTAWLDALKQHRVVAVRRDEWTQGRTWMHASSPEVLEFVKGRETEWRWWDNPAIERPMISIVPVRPEDELEAARPEKGVTLRIRCAWQNTAQGLLKQPLAELVSLRLDNADVVPKHFSKRRPNGLFDDDYYHANFPDLPPGKHLAKATARLIQPRREIERTLEFVL